MITEPLRLMCILAHPDDESLGTGGILAKYAAEGVETYLVMATRGERGWTGPAEENPGLTALGQIREAELLAAAEVLGLCRVDFLDYIDGDLDQADPDQAICKIVTYLRRVRPQVVVTFGPDGSYGHPDHIAISQFTAAAVVCAADASYAQTHADKPHRVAKLYYTADSKALNELVEAVIGEVSMAVDGLVRHAVSWEDWAITSRIDASAYWRTVWQAAECHYTQLLPFHHKLASLSAEEHQNLWRHQTFYRVFSLVNSGRQVEEDLFEGLR